MALVVQKFGGTSVADVACIQNAARRVLHEIKRGHQPVVVVSAMAGVTNQLVDLVRHVNPHFDAAEYDVVVASGEQVTTGLMALALQALGVKARSYLGWQVPFHTDANHESARVESVDITHLRQDLAAGIVPVIAGFQGLSPKGRVTTFGRGGSDITAVALAAALNADRCDLYKDVTGIFTADPRLVPQARQLPRLSYSEMLELASLGSKVIQTRAVQMAMAYGVPLRLFSSFEEAEGTHIVHEDELVEKSQISGVVCNKNVVRALVRGALTSGLLAQLFRELANAQIDVDMVTQELGGTAGRVTFVVQGARLEQVQTLLEQPSFAALEVGGDMNLAKISIVGLGLKGDAGIAALVLETLEARAIPVFGLATSEMRLSVLVADEYAELAVRALHGALLPELKEAA
ncbi:MAG: aspartate kinase [Holosporales bacterium]